MSRSAFLAAACAALAIATPHAAAAARTFHVSPAKGSDRGPGTAKRPLRTVAEAWNRIPARTALRRPYVIRLSAGRYGARSLPNYWESRHGTARAPVTIEGPRRGTARLTSGVNLFDLRHVTFRRLTLASANDLFHCERCEHVTLTASRLLGADGVHENVKINQSTDIVLTRNTISGAGDNAIDLVAVQRARIEDNEISGAGDWCVYAKGGSADVSIARNRIHDCGTGGVTAGQGTGLQFMVAPYFHYEAYRVRISDNDVLRVAGAAFGVNGGTEVTIDGNRAYDVCSRSHWVEVVYGLRSCDGRPGDEGRERCAALLRAGAWGTTEVDDGTNAIRIPNRNVEVSGNVIDQPSRRGDSLFSVAEPAPAQPGSGLGAVRADEDLRVLGNRMAGEGVPAGLPETASIEGNVFEAAPGSLLAVQGTRLVPAR